MTFSCSIINHHLTPANLKVAKWLFLPLVITQFLDKLYCQKGKFYTDTPIYKTRFYFFKEKLANFEKYHFNQFYLYLPFAFNKKS